MRPSQDDLVTEEGRQSSNDSNARISESNTTNTTPQPGFAVRLLSPRLTEHSFAQMIESLSLKNRPVAAHEIFARGRAPLKHIDMLSNGDFAVVDKVQFTRVRLPSAKVYARKVIKVSRLQNSDDIFKELEELEIAKSRRHRHIVSIVTTYEEIDLLKRSCGIIMEPVADCSLKEYMSHLGDSCMSDPQEGRLIQGKWFGCLASALAFLHAQEICHMNINPSNILVKNSDIFLTEFGISNHFKNLNINGATGPENPTYRAPEVDSHQLQSLKADVFSLGCIFLEMLIIVAGMSQKDFAKWQGDDHF